MRSQTLVVVAVVLGAGPFAWAQPVPAPDPVPPVFTVRLEVERGLPKGASAKTQQSMRPDAFRPTPHDPKIKVPEDLPPGEQRWGVLRAGPGGRSQFHFVIVGDVAKASTLYMDLDQDRDLTDEKPLRNQGNGKAGYAARLTLPVRYGEGDARATASLRVWFYTSFERGRCDYYAQEQRVGRLPRTAPGERPLRVHVFEEHCDGDFSDAVVAIDVDGDGVVQKAERIALGETVVVGGQALLLRSVSPDGRSVHFRPVERKVGRQVAGEVESEKTVKPFHFLDVLTRRRVHVGGPRTRGKVVVLDFWATWCGPCLADLPHVKRLHAQFGPRRDFLLVGISLDSDPEKLKAFLREQGIGWPQRFEGTGWQDTVAAQYGVKGIPATFVIDGRGRIRHVGLRGQALADAVAELLAER